MTSVSKPMTRAAQRPGGGRPPLKVSPKQGEHLTWQVNWRLLLGTLLGLGLVSPIAYFWHGYQLKRNGTIFLNRADKLEADQDWGEAAKLVERYLKVFPEDVEARVRLAQVFDHVADESAAKIPTSARLFSVAVGLAPDRPDLRLRHAERLMEMGRFREALAEVDESLRLQTGDPKALRLRAIAAAGDARSRGDFGNPEELVRNYRAAIEATRGSPDQIDLAIQLAEMYRRELKEQSEEQRRAEADQVVDEMVSANADARQPGSVDICITSAMMARAPTRTSTCA